ncbi:hypothetical protein MF271_01835 (plasmid) [Deinococcus sp. KNUC1210]|uniref:hypothetical protein n=1 Tax=Deinococcus sp. KNUC1210 TaxID=2917691 RepID=UPI001EF07C09|nr:hypothetical protein [Deinococcus sp. KNUC1210]ULH14285.1 hypothetical protein MF271_01835 [Deinococcus sp. KNUC1210]
MIDRQAAADALEHTANLLTITSAMIQMHDDFEARKMLFQLSTALNAAQARADWGSFARTLLTLTAPADPEESEASAQIRTLTVEFVEQHPDLFPRLDKEPLN